MAKYILLSHPAINICDGQDVFLNNMKKLATWKLFI